MDSKYINYRNLIVFLILLLSLSTGRIHAQGIGIHYKSKDILEKGDTVIIELNQDVRGNIQWQISEDAKSWADLESKHNDSLVFVAEQSAYYRAVIKEENCEPIYSDTARLGITIISEQTKVIDTNTTQLVSDTLDLESGRYKYIYSEGDLGITDTSVIVGYEGYGYIRKVNNVSIIGDTIVVETEPGRLTDVFEELHMQDSLRLLINSEKKSFYEGKPVPMQVTYLAKGVSLQTKGSGLDISGAVLYDDTYNNTHLQVSLPTATANFEPVFKRDIDIKWIPPSLNYLKLTAGGVFNMEVAIKVSCDYEIDFSKEKKIAEFEYGPFMIGGVVPMFVGLSFTAGFETSLEMAGSITSGFETTQSLEFGAEYIKDATPKWNTIWEKGGSFDPLPMEWDASAEMNAKAYISPRISATIGNDPLSKMKDEKEAPTEEKQEEDISQNEISKDKFIAAGPYFEVNPYLRFYGLVNTSQWEYGIYGGVEGILGFDVSAFGYTIADYNTTLAVWELPILEEEGVYEHYSPVVETHDITNITSNSAESGGNISDDGGSSILKKGLCWSTSPHPTLADDTTNEGGGMDSFSSKMENLASETEYYVRAYAINETDTGYGGEKSFTTNIVPSEDLIAYYPFNGTANDESGNENNGTIYGSLNFVEDRFGNQQNAIKLDGVDDKIIIPNLQIRFPWSISLWTGPLETENIYTLITDHWDSYWADYYGFRVVVDSEGKLRGGFGNGHGYAVNKTKNFVTINSVIKGNDWYHIAITFLDYNTIRIYVDGIEVETEITGNESLSSISYQNEDMEIGADDYDTGERYWKGKLDDIRIYNKVLSEQEIQDLYGNYEQETGTFTDSRDGQTYEWVKIGDQVWMAENLAYLPSVNSVEDGSENNSSEKYYYVYGYDGTNVSEAKATENYDTYGVLYNWNAVMDGASSSSSNPSDVQGVCPDGWHVPSDEEWKELEMQLGMSQSEADNTSGRGTNEGSKLAGNASLWNDGDLENNSAFGSSGFTALPGGLRGHNGNFGSIGLSGYWWSSAEHSSSSAWYRHLSYGYSNVYRFNNYKDNGFSVRCVRDD